VVFYSELKHPVAFFSLCIFKINILWTQ
jgi:hypothetical protein